jgi:GNAT superfamily N-acetyltransferase
MDTPDLRWSTDDGLPTALADAVDAGLGDANLAAEPRLADVRPLAIGAWLGDRPVGGAIGRTWGECAEVQQLWVDPGLRCRGIGARLLNDFERAAVARGAKRAYLDTFSFQAPGFYAAQGWRVVLEIAGFADGVCKFTLMKDLKGP